MKAFFLHRLATPCRFSHLQPPRSPNTGLHPNPVDTFTGGDAPSRSPWFMHMHQPNPSVLYQHISISRVLGVKGTGRGEQKGKQASVCQSPSTPSVKKQIESTCLRRMETSLIATGLGQNSWISRARPEASLRLNNGQALCPQTVLVIPKRGPGSPLNAKKSQEPGRRLRVST